MANNRNSKISSVKKRIVPIQSLHRHVKVCLYGPNGSGKTRIAATGPNVILADVDEEGTMSIRNYPGDMFQIKSWEDFVYFYWYLRSGDHPYETVVIDTVTQLQEVCIKRVLKDAVDRDPNRDPKAVTWKEWSKVGVLMREQIYNFRNLPMHVVFVCQERYMEEENDDGEVERRRVPNLSPKSRSAVTDSVDIIGKVFQREVRRVNKKTKKEVKEWETLMLVGPHNVYATKDRTYQLGRIVRKPTIPLMIQAAQSIQEED